MAIHLDGGFDDGLERPADSVIQVDYFPDRTVVVIPARPLVVPLRLLLFLNCGSIVFLVAVGILYIFFHVALFTGLPEPSAVFTGRHEQARWLAEVAVGWVLAIAVMVTILGLVWIPQVSSESIELDRHGIRWRREGWWKREAISAKWQEINDIVLLGNLQEIVTNRLTIQLFSGRQQTIAESTSNREREWLEAVLSRASARHRGI